MPFDGSPGAFYERTISEPVPTLPKARRLGRAEPRLATPPLRNLTPETSLGYEVIEFARDVLLVELLPWQKALLIRALELLPDATLRFRTIVVLVARQNGKSLVSQVLAAWWLFVCGCRTVLGTAQDLDTAEDVWEGVVDLIESNPELAALADKPIRVNGKKAIRLYTGERYKVKAANRRAGRGLTGDRIMLDEIREHQTWDAWGAITKTTRTKQDAQIWCFSNAGDITSVVLRSLRLAAHRAIGDPDGIVAAGEVIESLTPDEAELDLINARLGDDEDLDPDDFEIDGDDLCLLEWSSTPGASKWDRREWAQSNPSLGYLITEKTIASECRTDPEWVFRTESLCQWPDGAVAGTFDAGAWEACAVEAQQGGRLRPLDRIRLDRPRHWGLAVTSDRRWAFIAVAGTRTSDDVPQIEIAAKRVGTDWVSAWFTEKNRADTPVAIRHKSQAWALREDLTTAGASLFEWKGDAIPTDCAWLYEAVRAALKGEPGVRHTGDPTLNQAAQVTRIKVLAAGAWDWDLAGSPREAAALDAATAALAGLRHNQSSSVDAGPPPLPTALSAVASRRPGDIATTAF